MVKRYSYSILIFVLIFMVQAEIIKKTFTFSSFQVLRNKRGYDEIILPNSMPEAKIGEPQIPYIPVVFLLKPHEEAVDITVTVDEPVQIPCALNISPQQMALPISSLKAYRFQYNQEVYTSFDTIPRKPFTQISTRYMNGYALAMALITPIQYIPGKKQVTLFKKVNVSVKTDVSRNSRNSIQTISNNPRIIKKIRFLVHNPEALQWYSSIPRSSDDYDMLIVTVSQLSSGFKELIDFYNAKNVQTKLITLDSITAQGTGIDTQEKLRNHIIKEVNDSKITAVLLGGDVEHIPYRGMYVSVKAADGTVYEDNAIPADVYYSALDGNFNANGNTKFGEKDVDSVDFLPDIAVGRMPVSTAEELTAMIKKSIAYQSKPVPNTFEQPLLAAEELDDKTLGGPSLDLLIGKIDENGFETDGIPSEFSIVKLYDTHAQKWTKSQLLEKINQGPSAIYHSGHSSSDMNMRFSKGDITDNNFSKANGQDNNYTFVNTVGCNCGSFDKSDCIGEKMVLINNFAVAFIGNSRYGWYYPESSDGPSSRIQRFFVQALHTEHITQMGAIVTYSKVKFAPHIDVSEDIALGARRWCYYANNLLGDPAMDVWASNNQTSISSDAFLSVLKHHPQFHVTKQGNRYRCTVTLVKPEYTSVQILDLKGRVVSILNKNSLVPGTHRFEWNAAPYAKGHYFFHVMIANRHHYASISLL